MNITIKETSIDDLENVMDLWNNGEVMFYVGFPQGLGVTSDQIERWFLNTRKNPFYKHFSIYTDELGYCGETCYDIDREHDLASLDIKLLPKSQGKGIASYSLSYAINQVFDLNVATKAYVEPNLANQKAWSLYKRIGFVSKPRPEFLEPDEMYLEITKDSYIR
ncbi:MAG: GNAT family N-acetyltransferase [Paraclostridium sp.]